MAKKWCAEKMSKGKKVESKDATYHTSTFDLFPFVQLIANQKKIVYYYTLCNLEDNKIRKKNTRRNLAEDV